MFYGKYDFSLAFQLNVLKLTIASNCELPFLTIGVCNRFFYLSSYDNRSSCSFTFFLQWWDRLSLCLFCSLLDLRQLSMFLSTYVSPFPSFFLLFSLLSLSLLLSSYSISFFPCQFIRSIRFISHEILFTKKLYLLPISSNLLLAWFRRRLENVLKTTIILKKMLCHETCMKPGYHTL